MQKLISEITQFFINSSFLKLGYISFLKTELFTDKHIFNDFVWYKGNIIAQQVYSLNMYSLKSVLLFN